MLVFGWEKGSSLKLDALNARRRGRRGGGEGGLRHCVSTPRAAGRGLQPVSPLKSTAVVSVALGAPSVAPSTGFTQS